MKQLLTRLRFFFSRTRRGELDEELQFHIEQSIQANIAAEMSPQKAHRQAMIAFGGVERAREEVHEQHPRWWIGTVQQDVRYDFRGFRRNPLPTITVIAKPSIMTRNWQQPDWPNFRWDRPRISAAEEQFLLGAALPSASTLAGTLA